MSATVDALQQALDRARNGTEFEPIVLPRESDKQMAARLDAARQKTDVPFLEAGDAALEVESHTRGLTRGFVEQQMFRFDPNDVPPTPGTSEFKMLTDGVPEEYWPNLGRGRSAAHREFIKQNIFEEMDATRKLEEAGWVGTTLRIGTAVLDPVSLLAISGTAGSSLMISSSRAVRAAKLAAAAGVENVALEATLFGTRETKDVDDLYVALVGGLVAGGAIGAILPKTMRKELYETGSEIMGGGPGPGRAIACIDAELDASRSIGAAEATRAPSDLLKEQPSSEILNTPQLKGVEAKLRYGLYAQAAKSDIPHIRYLGNKMFLDGVGQRGVAQGGSVEEFQRLLNRRALTTFYRDANPGLAEYLQ